MERRTDQTTADLVKQALRLSKRYSRAFASRYLSRNNIPHTIVQDVLYRPARMLRK
jgi:hypothetical protein